MHAVCGGRERAVEWMIVPLLKLLYAVREHLVRKKVGLVMLGARRGFGCVGLCVGVGGVRGRKRRATQAGCTARVLPKVPCGSRVRPPAMPCSQSIAEGKRGESRVLGDAS